MKMRILEVRIPQDDIRSIAEALGKIGKPYVEEIIKVYTSTPDGQWWILVKSQKHWEK